MRCNEDSQGHQQDAAGCYLPEEGRDALSCATTFYCSHRPVEAATVDPYANPQCNHHGDNPTNQDHGLTSFDLDRDCFAGMRLPRSSRVLKV